LSLQPTERKSPSRVMKPRSLSLDPTSKFRVQDPSPTGFAGAMLKLLGYYSKQSQLIRGANTLYSRISMQVDKPELYASESVITNTTLIHLHMCRFSHSLLLCKYLTLGFCVDGQILFWSRISEPHIQCLFSFCGYAYIGYEQRARMVQLWDNHYMMHSTMILRNGSLLQG
jgi:hypothetical protein